MSPAERAVSTGDNLSPVELPPFNLALPSGLVDKRTFVLYDAFAVLPTSDTSHRLRLTAYDQLSEKIGQLKMEAPDGKSAISIENFKQLASAKLKKGVD